MENRSSDDDNRNVYKSGKYDDEAWSYVQLAEDSDDDEAEDAYANLGVHESFYNTPADDGVGDEDVMIQTKQA